MHVECLVNAGDRAQVELQETQWIKIQSDDHHQVGHG
jgi:hypothetical protein